MGTTRPREYIGIRETNKSNTGSTKHRGDVFVQDRDYLVSEPKLSVQKHPEHLF